MLCNRVKDN